MNQVTNPRQQAVTSILREQLARGEVLRLRVTSDSMRPLIRAGDEVELVGVTDLTGLRPGDILTFDQAGVLMTHRLLGQVEHAGERAWLTQGDNLLAPDLAWPDTCLLGHVVTIVSRGRVLSLERDAGRQLDARLQAVLAAERGIARVVRRWLPPAWQRLALAALRRPLRALAAAIAAWY
ncbi:MAG: hypothetical protein JW850_22405 [Thermoflexales bacterium]|nr:hypothetical protein [Thermoflexales bacterium]